MIKPDEFIRNWRSALESYGTPRDFADENYVRLLRNNSDSGDIAIRFIVALGNSRRRELIEEEKKSAEERKAKGIGPRWKNDGGSCFLCGNVGQAEETGSNLILFFCFMNIIIIFFYFFWFKR